MRIISKFHDFYDSLSNGSDSQIWTRQQSIIFIDENDTFFKRFGRTNPFPVEIAEAKIGHFWKSKEFIQFELMILIFCGKPIPLWQCQNTISYNLEMLRPFVAKCGFDLEKSKKWSWMNPFGIADKLQAGEIPRDVEKLNLEYKCPIILLREYKGENRNLMYVMEMNPCLRDLDFHLHSNLVDTFQELERFIFNELTNTDNVTATGNDKVIATSKGFGHKYAFRKEPHST